MSLFRELKRRNVFRVAAAYVVTAWLLIEVGATLETTLRLPEWSDTLLAFFLILGFPVALFFSWAYEITPEGIRREQDMQPEASNRAVTGRKLNRILVMLMGIALVYFAVDRIIGIAPGPGAESSLSQPAEPPPDSDEPDQPAIAARSIAVLPFVNMSSDPEQEYFSDGLTEELLNLLAGIGELKVTARTSSFFYKDKLQQIPLEEIARQLEVNFVLEGSVRKSADRLRITAQLIKAEDGFHLWSRTWDRTFDDIFAIQDEIAAAVVGELQVTLLGAMPQARAVDPESWELTQQARFLFNRRAGDDLRRALGLFQQAVEVDPSNATAWAGMAPLYAWLFEPPQLADGLAAAMTAVQLDPNNAEAQARLSFFLFQTGNSDEGDRAWARAVDLGSDNALVQSMIAGHLNDEGDAEGGLRIQRLAAALDPLNPTILVNLCHSLLANGRLEEAEAQAYRLIELAPNSSFGYGILLVVRLVQGRLSDAAALLEDVERTTSEEGDSRTSLSYFVMIQHSLGNQEEAAAALTTLIESEGERFPVDIAEVYAWMGDADAAFTWLNRALEGEVYLSAAMLTGPLFNGLHDDPRWPRMLEQFVTRHRDYAPWAAIGDNAETDGPPP
jgi:adenylate cyclase